MLPLAFISVEAPKLQPSLGIVCVLYVLVIQSCSTLCDHKDCSPLGFSVHGILQAKILEWIASPLSRETSRGLGKEKNVPLIRPLTFTLSQPSRQENNAPYLNLEGLPWLFRWWRIWLQCRRPGFDPWVGKMPWRREWQPRQFSL